MTKKRRPKVMMRVAKGALVPADAFSAAALNRRVRVGELVACEVSKPRNTKFWRLAHQFGTLVRENIEQFSHLTDSHAVLKRLQIEADVGCEVIRLLMPGIGPVDYRTPLSLAFESMDETEFRLVLQGLCRHVAATYWPGLTPEAVEQLSQMTPAEAA